MNLNISIVRADLPSLAKDWSKCFIRVNVDGSTSSVKTKSTKHLGRYEWHDQFLLRAEGPRSVLRFELKRKSVISLFQPQVLAYVEMPVSELLLEAERASGQDEDIPLLLKPSIKLPRVVEETSPWQLFIRLNIAHDSALAEAMHSVPRISNSIAEIITKLEAFIQFGDAIMQLHPYAFVAWRALTSIYTIIKSQIDQDSRLDALASLMCDTYKFIDEVKLLPERIPTIEDTIRKLLTQTVECTMFIRECNGYGFGERLKSTASMARQVDDFTQSFIALKEALASGLTLQISMSVETQNLMKLNPTEMDDPLRPECLPNTRLDIIADIHDWVLTPTLKQSIFWLHGFPGAGKSAIATSVANMFRDQRRLGAFVFFTRGVESRSDPALLIRTVAYQLGEFDPRISAEISRVVEEIPSIKQAPLRWQFQKLLIDPLTSLHDFQHQGPILVVIDALDECGRTGTREELLRVIAAESSRLPSTLRIFVTSRADKDIHSAFATLPHILGRELNITSVVNRDDVRTYIHHRMVAIRAQNEYLGLSPDWPGASRVEALTLRAFGLFIWAATACRYVESGQDPEERLAQLLQAEVHGDSESALDSVYITALEPAGKWDDAAFAVDFREILGIVIVAGNPLTANTIDLLNADFANGRKKRPSLHTIQHLGCVLQWAPDKPIRVIHPSFADFITDRNRCGRDAWHIDKPFHHLRLARQCIARLESGLRKNICKLDLSMSFEIQTLPEDIAYPCRYWIGHICEVRCSEDSISQQIGGFLSRHFLHWVEAMVVMGQPRQTITLMDRLKDWVVANYAGDESLCLFVRDADRFCQAYVHVFEQHPLLVYQSALPFTPTSSVIYRTFNDPSLPQVDGFRDQWSPLLSEFSLPGGNVTSLSCSPDGRYIVSTNTRAIAVWDSTSYELVTKLSSSIRDAINFVIFSPNSQHVASGYKDGSVRIWDALSGKQIVPTMEGHSGPVYALAFSEGGRRLISGGQDKKIVIWDTESGGMDHKPLMGHTKTVLCLASAPIGSRFASGSRDRSIRVCDTATGKEVLSFIADHLSAVTALVYTSDGKRLISASDNKTICVWDADSGTLLHLPGNIDDPFILRGHKSTVLSLAVSPDDMLLASASKDTSVRLWDIRTGAELSALVRQHRLPVRCVAFTPDGRRIVTSSSNDAILRVWDIECTGSMGIMRRHKGLVGTLAFSSDGKYLVSGGKDHRVQVWIVETGQVVKELFLEHGVYQVGFSPDDSKILAVDTQGAVFAWNANTYEPLMATPDDAPQRNGSRGLLELLNNRWIVEAQTERVLSVLPNMSPVFARASWSDRLAIGTANGGVVILRFPL
ncbi:hypothetical protein V8B97DRAFT_754129 [Scleroderma yunnanense]